MRQRVLVIDDDATYRKLVAALLQEDYEVSTASDGDEGFALIVRSPPDLAVVDVQMPRCDGLKVLRSIRAHATLRTLPVVMLSCDASRETVIAAVTAGANDYIIKNSFTREDFLRKIARALGARPAGAHAVAPRENSAPQPVSAATDPELQAVLDAWE